MPKARGAPRAAGSGASKAKTPRKGGQPKAKRCSTSAKASARSGAKGKTGRLMHDVILADAEQSAANEGGAAKSPKKLVRSDTDIQVNRVVGTKLKAYDDGVQLGSVVGKRTRQTPTEYIGNEIRRLRPEKKTCRQHSGRTSSRSSTSRAPGLSTCLRQTTQTGRSRFKIASLSRWHMRIIRILPLGPLRCSTRKLSMLTMLISPRLNSCCGARNKGLS